MTPTANTPKSIAHLLRTALGAHPGREHAFRLGYLETAAQEAINLLTQQPSPHDIALELDHLRASLIDHATSVRRKTGNPEHRISQLLGAIEASNLRLELLRDRLMPNETTTDFPQRNRHA